MTTTDPAPAQSEERTAEVSPEPILRLASGFMAAKHLFAASELGIFEALAESPAPLEALAARTGLTPRAARISADAMVALGLLERDGDLYRNGPAAAGYLAGRTPADLRPLLRFWDRISYPAWEALAEALGSGPPRQVFELAAAQQQIVSAGIEAILAGPAHAFAEVGDPGLLPSAPRRGRRHGLVVHRRRPAPSRPGSDGVRASCHRRDRPAAGAGGRSRRPHRRR